MIKISNFNSNFLFPDPNSRDISLDVKSDTSDAYILS